MRNISQLRNKRKERIVDSLRADVARLRTNGKIGRAWLFGSYARGNWNAASDVDVLVESAENISFRDFSIGKEMEMDVIVLTHEEIERRMGNLVFRETVEEGVPL